MNSQTVLITGGTGFIGRNLVKALMQKGYNLHLIVRQDSKVSLIEDDVDNLALHYYDGSIESIDNIFKDIKPSVVFHLASLFISEHEAKDLDNLIQSNIVFGTHLVDSMVRNGVYNLVNTGTSWQHFNNEDYNPVCLYAATKQAFEDIIKYYREAKGLKTITLKLFDTYGPGDNRPKLFNFLAKALKEKKQVSMSPGDQLIDLVYIDDVVNAFLKAQELLVQGQCLEHSNYAVSSQRLIKLKDLISLYSKIAKQELHINWGGRPYRMREVMIPWKNGEIIPGWKAQVTLEEGISSILRN